MTAAGQAALRRGDPVAALADAQAATGLLRQALGDTSPDVANVLVLQSAAECGLGRPEAGQRCAREAVAIMAALPAGNCRELDRVRLQAVKALGHALIANGEYSAAREVFTDALDAGPPRRRDDLDTIGLLNGLGLVGKYTGEFEAAAAYYARAMELVEFALGPEHVEAATLHHNLGGLAHSRGEPAAGERHAQRAVEIRERALGPDHPDVAADRAAYAAILHLLGRLEEAERLMRDAQATFARAFGDHHLEVGIVRTSLGAVLHQAGKVTEAEREYRTGLEIRERHVGPTHPELAASLVNLGTLLAARGQISDARELYERALRLLDGTVTAHHPSRAACIELLAELGAHNAGSEA